MFLLFLLCQDPGNSENFLALHIWEEASLLFHIGVKKLVLCIGQVSNYLASFPLYTIFLSTSVINLTGNLKAPGMMTSTYLVNGIELTACYFGEIAFFLVIGER